MEYSDSDPPLVSLCLTENAYHFLQTLMKAVAMISIARLTRCENGCCVNCNMILHLVPSPAPPTLIDVNECAVNNGGCSEECINLQGSFRCKCGIGKALGRNSVTCEGQ